MVRPYTIVTAAALAVALSLAASAQKITEVHPGKGGSPHVRSEWTIDGANISVVYGRPFLKGRTVGKEVAPYGKDWRTGADEATMLTTDRTLRFGKLEVPAGTYTLYTVPGEKDWQLVINKQTGQWGTQYSEEQDLGRVPMKVEEIRAPVEQLTISIEDTPAGGTLVVEWGTTRATAAFEIG